MSIDLLPSGWSEILTAETFNQVSTNTKKVKTKDCKSVGKFPVIDQGQMDVAGFVDDISKIINVTRPLVIFGDHTRIIKWVNRDFVPGADGTKVLEAANFLEPRYFYYQLKSIELPDKGYARHFRYLNETSFKVAPLAEQQQIAAKLDELLAQADTLKTRLDAIPKILKRFRQSVLAAAVSGKLTEDWRGSLSIDFNQSPVTIGVETDQAPKAWVWNKLINLALLESGHTPRKSVIEYWENGDVYWICLQDIRAAHGSIITDTKYKPTKLGIENSSARLLPSGTVCFSRDISVGFTTIMGKEMSTIQHFANWVCGENLNNKFLMFALMVAKEHLIISGQGTTVKTIYMPALKEFRLLTPPIKEQTEIVSRVEQLFTYTGQIEQRVKDAQARVNHLTQAILAKAFRGELTADWREQNPGLISGENSAAALLERIKLERSMAAAVNKIKPTRLKKPSDVRKSKQG